MRKSDCLKLAICIFASSMQVTQVAGQTPSDEPPPVFKGGIVHQLRSLSEDAMSALSGERGKAPRPAKVSRRNTLDSRTGLPPQPSGKAVLSRTHESPWEERMAEMDSRRVEASRSDSGQNAFSASNAQAAAEIISPQEALRTQAGGVSNRQPTSFSSEIYVETALPAAVRESLQGRLETSSRYQTQGDSQQFENDGLTDRPLSPTDPESQTYPSNNPPKVARIPLPGAGNKLPSTSGTLFKPSATSPAPEAATLLPRSQTAQTAPTASKLPTPKLPAYVGTETNSANDPQPRSVSVPTQLVGRSASESKPVASATQSPSAQLPAFPTKSDVADNSSVATPPSINRVPLPNASIESAEPRLPAALPAQPAATLPALPASPSMNSATLPTLPSASAALSTDAVSANEATRLQAANSDLSGSQPAPVESSTSPNSSWNPNSSGAIGGSGLAGGDERLRMRTPGISVVLNGPSDLPVGAPATYSVVVENDDDINLEGLILRLDLPPGIAARAAQPSLGVVEAEQAGDGATLLTWMFERLEAGKKAQVPLQITASQARNFAIGMEWTLMPVIGNARMGVLSPQIELALEGPSEVTYGQANIYRLHVRNPGNADAENVVITLSAGPYGESSSPIGTVKAGAEQTVDVELTFNQQGTIDIAASASATGELTSETAIEVLVQRASIAASLEAPQIVYHGSATPYVLVLQNTGDATASDVQASLELPQGASLVQVPANGVLRDGKLFWKVSELKAGAELVEKFQLNLAEQGDNIVALTCTADRVDAVRDQVVTRVEAIADLKLIVNDPIAPAPVGSDVVYELTLTNRGSKAAKNVRVITHFSNGIEPIRGEGHAASVEPGQVYFEPIPSVEAGQTIELKVYARAESDGTHRFRAEVRADDSDLRLVQEESTRYLDAIRRIATPSNSSGSSSIIR